MRKIVIASRFLKWSSIGLMVLLPLIEAGYWITSGYPFLPIELHAEPLPLFGDMPVGWGDLTENQKLLGFLANLLPIIFSMIALGNLAKLFHSFEHAKLFNRVNSMILKNIGWALVWGQVAEVLHTGLLSLILTYRLPVGHRNLTIAIGSHQLGLLAIGLFVLLISWMWVEAAKLQEENEGTV
jgi:hypothetical protein